MTTSLQVLPLAGTVEGSDVLRRAVAVEALPQSWRETFLERLELFS